MAFIFFTRMEGVSLVSLGAIITLSSALMECVKTYLKQVT